MLSAYLVIDKCVGISHISGLIEIKLLSFFQTVKPVEDMRKRCVHFYACLCAFASDEKLAEEFNYYINLDVKNQGMIEGEITVAVVMLNFL